MAALEEGKHTGEFIGEMAMGVGFHVDADGVAASGQTFEPGTVLARLTADNTLVAYDSTADTGAEVAVAISYAAVDASEGEVEDVRYFARGPAVVTADNLEWGSNDAAGIAAGKAALLALSIKTA